MEELRIEVMFTSAACRHSANVKAEGTVNLPLIREVDFDATWFIVEVRRQRFVDNLRHANLKHILLILQKFSLPNKQLNIILISKAVSPITF